LPPADTPEPVIDIPSGWAALTRELGFACDGFRPLSTSAADLRGG
jgi:hypothetical protein